ncbi:MAG: pilus assembly protein PilM [Patescibacteria group bacterium]
MFDRLKNFLGTVTAPHASFIGVDVGSAYLKIVQFRRKGGKAVLETYGALALGPYAGLEIGRATRLPPDKLAEALRDVLREAHATSTRSAFAIPFSSSLVATMQMRVLDMKQLPTMVSLEARKYVPVPISEVNLDWWIIPEEPAVRENSGGLGAPKQPVQPDGLGAGEELAPALPGEGEAASARQNAPIRSEADDSNAPKNMKILIAAIHNEALGRYQQVVRESGLQSSFFEIELFSTIRALLPQDLEAHAVLDLGAGETKLYVIDRGLVRLSHIMSHGGQDITLALSQGLGISVEEAEKKKRRDGIQAAEGAGQAPVSALLNVVFSETNRALLGFERRFGRKIQDVILSGGGANLPGIARLAGESVSVPVRRADPFKQAEAPAFLEEVLQGVGPEFSVAAGIAFRGLQEEA